MKKPYEKPTVSSESIFETLAISGCTLADPALDTNCDPYFGVTLDTI